MLTNNIFAVTLALLLALPIGTAYGKTVSTSNVKATQIRIVQSDRAQPYKPATAWGIDSRYIGPGEIRKLISIDIYLDAENRISTVKVIRETNVGDKVTLLFNDVLELSIQSLGAGKMRPHKEIPITVRTADELTFP